MFIQINLRIIKEENLCILTPYWCYLLLTFSYPFFYPSLHLTNIPDPSTLHFGQSIFNPFVYWGVGVSSCLTRSATNDTNLWPMYLYDIVYISINIYNTRAPDPGCQLWRRQKKMLYNENIESHFTILCTV